MKKNTKNIAAVAILGLAVGAFVVDRFVLGYGGPASAGAAVEAMTDQPATSKPAATTAILANGPSVALRIAALKGHLGSLDGPPSPELVDAFVVPTVWRAEMVPAPSDDSAKASLQRSAESKQSEGPKLVLTAVIANPDTRLCAATINGVVVQIGETYKGYKLMSVDKTAPASATLEGPGGPVVLHTKQEDAVNASEAREGKPLVRTYRSRD